MEIINYEWSEARQGDKSPHDMHSLPAESVSVIFILFSHISHFFYSFDYLISKFSLLKSVKALMSFSLSLSIFITRQSGHPVCTRKNDSPVRTSVGDIKRVWMVIII